MRSAAFISPLRWVTATMVVRPRSDRSAAATSRSAVASNGPVAWSSTRSAGRRSSAPASTIRWRSPRDSRAPRSATTVSRPSGRAASKSAAAARRGARHGSSSGAPGSALSRFARIVSRNRGPLRVEDRGRPRNVRHARAAHRGARRRRERPRRHPPAPGRLRGPAHQRLRRAARVPTEAPDGHPASRPGAPRGGSGTKRDNGGTAGMGGNEGTTVRRRRVVVRSTSASSQLCR